METPVNTTTIPLPAESCLATSRSPLSRYTYIPKTVGVAETHDRKYSLASQVSGTPQEPQKLTRRIRIANEGGEKVHGTETCFRNNEHLPVALHAVSVLWKQRSFLTRPESPGRSDRYRISPIRRRVDTSSTVD